MEAVQGPSRLDSETLRQMRRAMSLSVGAGVLMLAGKTAAWLLTGSAAIFSDAAESVIHVVAVAFAAFSLRLSARPADHRFPFGYERITFFSAGFEGALIVLAAAAIIYSAIRKWMDGLALENLGAGTLIVFGAALLNAGLGYYLVWAGRRTRSLILEANGKHVLTDCWTSFGVAGGLLLVRLTGWLPFDPLCAMAVAANILWSGGRLVWRSVSGLLDYSDPAVARRVLDHLAALAAEFGVRYHDVRSRNAGHRLIVNVHLLFPATMAVGEAHRIATLVEQRLPAMLDMPAEVVTHLESAEDHAVVHPQERHTGAPE